MPKEAKIIFGSIAHNYISTLTELCESYFSQFPFTQDRIDVGINPINAGIFVKTILHLFIIKRLVTESRFLQ